MTGRVGRIVVAILGVDQHEAGALSAAALLRDAGFEVIYLGRFNAPSAVVAAALAEDADVIGISTHSWEYLEYLDELKRLIADAGLDTPLVIGGSVVTPDDERSLKERGVAATFGPGSSPSDITSQVRALIR